MWADTFLIVFISICTAFLGEGMFKSKTMALYSVMLMNFFCQYCRAHLGPRLPHRKIPEAEERSR